jgi:hypothetical protein
MRVARTATLAKSSPHSREINVAKFYSRGLFLIELLALLLALYAAMLLLSGEMSMLTFSNRTLVFLAVAIWIVFLVVICRDISWTFKFIRNPFADVLRDAQEVSHESSLWKILEGDRAAIEIGPVELLVSERINDVITVHRSLVSFKPLIVVPKAVIQSLDPIEFRTVLVHELYHIQVHGTEELGIYIADRVLLGRFGWSRILVIAALFTAFFTPIPAIDSTTFPVRESMVLFLDIFSILSLGLALFAFFYVLGFLIKTGTKQGWPSPYYLYMREFLADAYSALWTQQPGALKNAIEKCSELFSQSNFRTLNDITGGLGFIGSNNRVDGATRTLKELMSVGSLQTKEIARQVFNAFIYGKFVFHKSCPTVDRKLLVEKIERLLHERVTLTYINEVSFDEVRQSMLPAPVRHYLNDNKETFERFVSYVRQNSLGFSIVECSRELNVELFNVFKMLIASIESGMVDLPHPL